MTKVTAQMSVSLDGCYAGPRFHGGPDGDWLASGEAAGFFRITRWVIDAMAWRERLGFVGGEQSTNSEIIAETFEAAGAYVMGRRVGYGREALTPHNVPMTMIGASLLLQLYVMKLTVISRQCGSLELLLKLCETTRTLLRWPEEVKTAKTVPSWSWLLANGSLPSIPAAEEHLRPALVGDLKRQSRSPVARAFR